MGGSTTTQSSGESQTSPWAPQAGQLQNIFGQAENIYNNRTAQGPYQGDYYAGITAPQTAGVNYATDWAGGTGANLASGIANESEGLYNEGGLFAGNAANMAANGAPVNTGLETNYAATGNMPGATQVNPQLLSSINAAGTAGANSLAGYNQGITNVMNAAAQDPTQQLTADAGQYMSGSPVQSMVNSTNAAIGQTLNEQTLPGLNRSAAMGGNLNSSRAGAANAMAQEGAALAEGSADSNILNNAYNTGLGTASTQRIAGLNTGLSAAEGGFNENANMANSAAGLENNMNQFDVTSQLGAENAANSTALSNAGLEEAANSQLGSATQMGMEGASEANQLAAQNYGLDESAGGVLQQNNQGELTNDYDKWQMNNTYDQNLLQNYYGIVGAGNWGGTTTSNQTQTQTQNPNPIVAGLGAAAGIGSMFASGGMFGSGGAFGGLGGLFGGGEQAIGGMSLPSSYGYTGYTQLPTSIPGYSG